MMNPSMLPLVNPLMSQVAGLRSASIDKTMKKSDCSVIIRDLSFFCNENHLKELVTCYGPCTKIHICRSEESNHRSLLHAFVEMTSEEAIYALIEDLHCVLFMGRQLKIQRCHENPEMKEIMNQKVEKMGIQVYVRFESMEDRGHGLVNEERFRDVFADCGDIEDSIIQRHSQNLWRQKGYGFIFFLTFEGAEMAVKHKNGIMYDNVYYQCEYTHKAKEKINAIIATPDQFRFYQVGAKGTGPPFPTAFEATPAVPRVDHTAYSSPANPASHSSFTPSNYSYTSQDPTSRPPPTATAITRTTSFPTTSHSSVPLADSYSVDRSDPIHSSASVATTADDQSWNFRQPSVSSSLRVSSTNNLAGSSYSSNSWTSATPSSAQEFIRTSDQYTESVSPSYSQLSQQSSFHNHYPQSSVNGTVYSEPLSATRDNVSVDYTKYQNTQQPAQYQYQSSQARGGSTANSYAGLYNSK